MAFRTFYIDIMMHGVCLETYSVYSNSRHGAEEKALEYVKSKYSGNVGIGAIAEIEDDCIMVFCTLCGRAGHSSKECGWTN
jgi:hypothetical protein